MNLACVWNSILRVAKVIGVDVLLRVAVFLVIDLSFGNESSHLHFAFEFAYGIMLKVARYA